MTPTMDTAEEASGNLSHRVFSLFVCSVARYCDEVLTNMPIKVFRVLAEDHIQALSGEPEVWQITRGFAHLNYEMYSCVIETKAVLTVILNQYSSTLGDSLQSCLCSEEQSMRMNH